MKVTEKWHKVSNDQTLGASETHVCIVESNRLETDFGFREKLCGSYWSSQRTLRIFGWEGPNFRAISREFPHDFRPTAAIKTSSFAGVRKVCGRLAFTSSVGITLLISRRSRCNRRNTVVSRWRQPEWSVIFCAVMPWTKRMSQYWSCVPSTMIPPKRSPAAHLSTDFSGATVRLLRRVLPHLSGTCIPEGRRLRTYAMQMLLLVI
jgi:hypothetical protein